MIVKGTYLKVKTTTQEDVCGVCLYQVMEDGLEAPEPDRKGQMDGVKCVMLGGSGPAARPGWAVIDSVAKIQREIKSGVTQVLSAQEGERLRDFYAGQKDSTPTPKTYGTGIEVEI
jgi:hypothetical protein